MIRTPPSFDNGQALAGAPVLSPAQLGGIETSVLDNGPGRGVRIAWVNTGGGLRYKVVIDRGLDIADAEFLGRSLTWHSLTGITAPTPANQHRMNWLRGFFGGLVVGCGPLNAGDPFVENGQEYGLHGTHSNTLATVESVTNPDPARGQYEMSIVGTVRTARVFGPNLELRRTIRSVLGRPTLEISDEFLNRGNEPAPFAWVLHINFGYPLLEPGHSTYCYDGMITPAFGTEDWFRQREDFRAAPEPQEAHRGTGEAFCYIDPVADSAGNVLVGGVNVKRGFGVKIEFTQRDYPRLGNWQHWGPMGSYLGAVEPMTAGVEGHSVDRKRGWFECLEPGETRALRCTLTATNDEEDIRCLLDLNRGQSAERRPDLTSRERV